jgi:hypothetical protein
MRQAWDYMRGKETQYDKYKLHSRQAAEFFGKLIMTENDFKRLVLKLLCMRCLKEYHNNIKIKGVGRDNLSIQLIEGTMAHGVLSGQMKVEMSFGVR